MWTHSTSASLWWLCLPHKESGVSYLAFPVEKEHPHEKLLWSSVCAASSHLFYPTGIYSCAHILPLTLPLSLSSFVSLLSESLCIPLLLFSSSYLDSPCSASANSVSSFPSSFSVRQLPYPFLPISHHQQPFFSCIIEDSLLLSTEGRSTAWRTRSTLGAGLWQVLGEDLILTHKGYYPSSPKVKGGHYQQISGTKTYPPYHHILSQCSPWFSSQRWEKERCTALWTLPNISCAASSNRGRLAFVTRDLPEAKPSEENRIPLLYMESKSVQSSSIAISGVWCMEKV